MNITKQEIWYLRQENYGISGLLKINSMAFLEVNLLVKNPFKG